MKKLEGYMAGFNLGHWISQYENHGKEYWDTYITEPDFKRIKDWGMDHVRLPIDYPIFYNPETGEFIEEGLKYADFAIEMCKKYGLNVVLDLHHTPGYAFWNKYDKQKNSLFTSEDQQKVFLNIWEMFANRYKAEGDNLYFELLNELVLEESEPWNALWPKAVELIHSISPDRKIIVGSNRWNSVDELKNLTFVDDERIIYNFHCYAPIIFTHQRAPWEPDYVRYQKSVTYPFRTAEHAEYFEMMNDYWIPENFEVVDKEAMKVFLKAAYEFVEEHDVPLYCGEFGVIGIADDDSAVRWLNDIIDIFLELGIGHAVWSYRGFSHITDKNNELCDERFIEALSRK